MDIGAFLDPALQQLLPALGTLVGSLLAWAIWSLLDLIKNERLRRLADQAVALAEQRIDVNSDKLSFAKNYLRKRLGSKIEDEDLEAAIEQAVLQLKTGLRSHRKEDS